MFVYLKLDKAQFVLKPYTQRRSRCFCFSNIQASLWLPLPSVIMGVVGVLAGISCLYLPETLGKEMVQTTENAEMMDR